MDHFYTTSRFTQCTIAETVLDNTAKDWDDEFHLNKKKYYNLILSTTRSREDILTGLLAALDSPNFTAKVRYLYVKDMHRTITTCERYLHSTEYIVLKYGNGQVVSVFIISRSQPDLNRTPSSERHASPTRPRGLITI